MKSALFAFLLIIFISLPFCVSAHPIDEIDGVKTYDQKQIITVGSGKIVLTIDLTFYALDKTRLWDSIDMNKDRNISDEEKSEWMNKGKQSSWISIDDKRIDFTPISLSFPDYYDFFSSKPAKIIIIFESHTLVKVPGNIEYHYKGKDRSLSEIQFEAHGMDNIAVQSVEKKSPTVISLHLLKGSQNKGQVLGVAATDRVSSFLNTYIKSDNVSFSVQMYALVIAMILGAIHALTPGHGKAITAGYLVGSRGTFIHALYLGLIITITHTASVFILGGATLFLSAYIVPSTIIKSLNVVSGLLIVGFGVFLLFQRISHIVNNRKHTHEHPQILNQKLTFKHLLAFGISGGIVPCVDALAILLVAVSLQKIMFGLIILVAFSIGLSFALTASGMLALTAKKKLFERFENLDKLDHYLGVLSAFIVTILGIMLLIKR